MNLKDINNTQLVLLTLFVSFVTSVATGITTVTLLEEAPPVITQTINRIVERTVEVVSPPKTQPAAGTQTIVVKEEEFITNAAQKNAPNVVEIGRLKKRFRVGGIGRPPVEEYELELLGTAFALNSNFIVSQYKSVGESDELVARATDSRFFRIAIALENQEQNLILFKTEEQIKSLEGVAVNSEPYLFANVSFAQMGSIKIGQTALALGIQDGVLLSLGVISQVKTKDVVLQEGEEALKKEIASIHTTLDVGKRYAGGPLLSIDGNLIGVNVLLEGGDQFAVPAQIVEALMKKHANEAEKSTP